jgi:ParB family chromosome partitioning protein
MENTPTVITLSIAEVRIPESRLRGLGDLDALRESIASAGLLQPIIVDKSHTLVCGLHRLEACRSLGWTRIAAVVDAFEGPRARLAEVDENLCRRELTVLERAEHIALRRTLWAQMQPPAAPPTDPAPRGKKVKPPEAPLTVFVDDTARKTGRAKAAVREELRIGELPEDVRAVARETPVSNNKRELLALTRMPQEEQRRAVAAVKSGEAKTVRPKVAKPAPEAVNEGECPFDLAEGDGTERAAATVTGDPEGYRDDPMSPWATPGGALERELARAQIVRLVGDAQRALAKMMDLWSGGENDEGSLRAREAVEAVERLSRWMERPSSQESWAATA